MEKERFLTLWEYASPGSNVTEEDVFRVCCMYLGSAAPTEDSGKAKLRAAVQATLAAAGSTASDAVSRYITQADNDLMRQLSEFTSVAGPTKDKEVLRTILDENLEDDEDDSSVNENQEEEKAPGLTILMRGFLKKKDGKVEWSGYWAMTTEAFDSGDKAKFRYELRGDASVVEEQDGKVTKVPKTATFDGSFLVKDQNAESGFVRIDEKSVVFEFDLAGGSTTKWKVKGKGQNVNGEFSVEGELDGQSRRFALFKTYYRSAAGGGSSDDESASDIDEEEAALDADEIEDLKADQRESFGRVLVDDDEPGDAKKKKKRRMVED